MIFNIEDNFEERFIVSDETHSNFIHLFKDCNPLHTNDQFAIANGFKGKVMHGNILNGFISYFIGERLPTKDVIIHMQEIHFKNPVYLNDVLLFNSEVINVFESVKAVEFKFVFKNMESKIVAKGKIQIGLLK